MAGRPPSAEVLEGWVGWRVTDVNGSSIGHVEGVDGEARPGQSQLGRLGGLTAAGVDALEPDLRP